LEGLTSEQLDTTLAALRALHEYDLHKTGVSYQTQGYHTGDGFTVPAWKADEHLLIDRLIAQAEKDKPKPKPLAPASRRPRR
jgi:hypothetical protein